MVTWVVQWLDLLVILLKLCILNFLLRCLRFDYPMHPPPLDIISLLTMIGHGTAVEYFGPQFAGISSSS